MKLQPAFLVSVVARLPRPPLPMAGKKTLQNIAAMVDRMDQAIGRVLARIKALGKQDNTLVIFLSDNGAAPFDRARKDTMGAPRSHWQTGVGWANASATPFRNYKCNMSNGGSCTPCVVSWPAPDRITPASSFTFQPLGTSGGARRPCPNGFHFASGERQSQGGVRLMGFSARRPLP